jgi:UDP-N-acetyl-2-amino-2-deoxyglucuronate dehydrogenase
VSRPVRVGAVGLGRWANVLADAYGRSAEVELVSCFSRSQGKREAFAARHGCASDTSYEALLARDDVDAVIVTVPNDHHAHVIEQAAAAGKHAFVEKPIAVSLEEASRIERAVDDAGVVFACGHSARRLGGLRKIKELMDSGAIGEVSVIEAVFANERGLQIEPGNWRGDPEKTPGGPLTQLGVHQIDNLQYLLGPVTRVATFGKPMYTRVKNDTVNVTLLEFERGPMAYLGTNWACPGVFSIDVYGTSGDLFYELDFSWWSNSDVTDEHSRLAKRAFARATDDPDDFELADVEVPIPRVDHLRDEVEEFARAVRGEGSVEVDARAAKRNVAVMLAAVRSSREGRIVHVDELMS